MFNEEEYAYIRGNLQVHYSTIIRNLVSDLDFTSITIFIYLDVKIYYGIIRYIYGPHGGILCVAEIHNKCNVND